MNSIETELPISKLWAIKKQKNELKDAKVLHRFEQNCRVRSSFSVFVTTHKHSHIYCRKKILISAALQNLFNLKCVIDYACAYYTTVS